MDLLHLSIQICVDNISSIEKKNIYCFAHNISSIPSIIKKLNSFSKSNIFILNNLKSMSGCENSQETKKFYKERGITVNNIIPYHHNIIHTRIEAESVVKWALDNKMEQLIICAPPFHIVRAFMTIVSVVIEMNCNLKIYALSGTTNDWNEEVITHQGLNKNTCNNFIDIEIERIYKYIKKKDILPISSIQTYLLNR